MNNTTTVATLLTYLVPSKHSDTSISYKIPLGHVLIHYDDNIIIVDYDIEESTVQFHSANSIYHYEYTEQVSVNELQFAKLLLIDTTKVCNNE